MVKSQLNTCGRANKWTLEAATASSSNRMATGKFAPRASILRSSNANVNAIASVLKNTTPFNPARW